MTTDDYEARLQEVVKRIESGLQEVMSLRSQIGSEGSQALSGIAGSAPAWVTSQFRQGLTDLDQALTQVTDTAQEWLGHVIAAATMWRYVRPWREIASKATIASEQLHPTHLATDGRWEGFGAQEYFQVVDRQSNAAKRVGELATATASTLQWSANEMLAFYGYLAIVLFRIRWALVRVAGAISAIVMALAAAARGGVRAWPFAAIVIVVALRVLVRAALEIFGHWRDFGRRAAALAAALTDQWRRAHELLTQMRTAFPDGRWPPAVTGRWDDSSDANRWDAVRP